MVLDSDILIYFLKGNQKVVQKVLEISADELFITRINYAELLFGSYNSERVKQNLDKIVPFLKKFSVLEFDEKSSHIFAQLKAKLKKEGNIIADMDLMIASIVISNNETLYTNNLKHFSRLDKLKLV
jgi:predicted nucleic acid-binding protein